VKIWMSLAAGSLAGGWARYAVTLWMNNRLGTAFPFGTLAVNVSGCFLAGFFDGLAQGRLPLSPETRVMLLTGFCGAFTTFSALVLETTALARAGDWFRSAAYVAASVALGLVFLLLGQMAGRMW
jgi:fluoride exporter